MSFKKGQTNSGSFKKGRIPHNKGIKPNKKELRHLKGIGFKKGQIPWNINKHPSSESIFKMRLAKIGKKDSIETRKKKSDAGKKKVFSEEHKKNLSKSQIGKYFSPETRIKQSKSHKGKIASLKTRIKMGESHKGDKCHFWRGGISFEPYTLDWTETLKRSIRERDNYTCQLCSELQSNKAFDVHHIDYNKKNCDPNNLITLCVVCHSTTNSNRSSWKEFFTDVMIKRLILTDLMPKEIK